MLIPRVGQIIVAVLCLSAVAAAQPFSPLPGYNVGINPGAFVAQVQWQGQPALLLLVPGNESIATFYDPRLMHAGSREVHFSLERWAVYEPNACAVGTELYFDTQNPLASAPYAHIETPGWNVYGVPFPIGYSSQDPMFSDWFLHYCSVRTCTSPCGPFHRNPEFEVYLALVSIR